MNVTRTDFNAIRAKIALKRRKRIDRIADNIALGVKQALGGQPRPENAPRDREDVKPKEGPSRLRIGAIKARILKSGGLWSLAVRKRDGNKCVMCGKTEYLQAHHWLFRRSHSMALAVDPANGITLCYGCHIGRVHRDGDGDFIIRLADKMTAIVGPDKVAEMRETAGHPQPLNLDWWMEAELKIKSYLTSFGK